MLADGPGLFGLWTGHDACKYTELGFFHGSINTDLPGGGNQTSFLSFVSWMWLYGESVKRPDIQEAAEWMAADPVTDAISLWNEGNGGIEGKGFTQEGLYSQIVPMASALDGHLMQQNSCHYNEIVGHVLSDEWFETINDVVEYAITNGADWGNLTDYSRQNTTVCLKAWETDGLSQWMANFVLPNTNANSSLIFSKHVRFGDGTTRLGLRLYNQCIQCSEAAWGLWKQVLANPSLDSPLERVEEAASATEQFIRKNMQIGVCGAPGYNESSVRIN
jgi:hypothetical protein